MYTKSSIGIYDSLYVYMYSISYKRKRTQDRKCGTVTRAIFPPPLKSRRVPRYVHVNFRPENQANVYARNAFVSNKFLHRDGGVGVKLPRSETDRKSDPASDPDACSRMSNCPERNHVSLNPA